MFLPRLVWSSISAAQPIIRPNRNAMKLAPLDIFFLDGPLLVIRPQHLEQNHRDDRVDVDTVDVLRHLGFEQAFHQTVVEIEEHVVQSLVLEQFADIFLTRINVNIFTF